MMPEILAPAGSIETLRAAIEAGADAVYLGYGDFNARKRAKNFTEEELRLAAEYVHRNDRKMYITLNTLVFDRELPAVLELLELIREVRADAVIVQDLGVLSLVRQHFEDLPVHASTQMFCHNSLHAEFLARQGVSRIILPRELSMKEIRAMMAKAPLEYEVFVHGAMCFGFSGCCLASSWLHEKSGNRGRCLQVCRHRFDDKSGGSHPFSMRDLDALALVEQLVSLGVTSLKIEGRMKGTGYVRDVVSAYRRVLDSIRDGKPLETIPPVPTQRESATGFFTGEMSYLDLVQPGTSGTTGEAIGWAKPTSPSTIVIELMGSPAKGTRLRVQDARGRNVCEGVLLDFSVRSKNGRRTLTWRLPHPVEAKRFHPPFSVYSIGKSAPTNAQRSLQALVRKVPIDNIDVEVEVSEGALGLRATTKALGLRFEKQLPIDTEVSRSHPLTEENLIRIFRQVGSIPFIVDSIECRFPLSLFVSVATLKQARRAFYAALHEAHEIERREQHAGRRKLLEGALEHSRRQHAYGGAPRTLTLRARPVPNGEGGEFFAERVTLEDAPGSGLSKEAFLLLPHFVPESCVEPWRERIGELTSRGYRRFLIPTYGWLSLFSHITEVEIVAGPYCHAVNSLAVDMLERCGASRFVSSPDVPDSDVALVAAHRGRLVGRGFPRELFVSRLRVPEGAYYLKGRAFETCHFSDYTVLQERAEP